MAEAKKLVPKRRFKGFTDDWEKRKLSDVVDIIMGQSPDGSTYTNIPNDHILVQGNADLKNGWVNPRVWTTQVTKKANAGDLIMSVRAPAGEMGKTAFNVVLGRGVAAIKGNEFIFQSLLKMNETGYWKKLSSGSTFDSLNSDNIRNAELYIPTQPEQDKLGTFFKTLDTLITLHQRKLDKLKSTKKAYLSEMFPVEGESKPKRRFKGFSGDWEVRKLGNIAQIKDSARVPNVLWRREGVPYLRSSNLDSTTNEFLYISQNDYEMYKSKTGAPEFGDVLFNSGGNIGTAILKTDVNPVYVQDGAVLYVKTSVSKYLNGMFLKYYYETPTIKKYIVESCVGGTIKHFTLVPANAMPILYPKIDEQKEIGFLFVKLDNLITLHQQKLDKLKHLKKSYLNEMFI